MANKIKKNIVYKEVEKFNLLAHKWWDETSEFKPLHQINPLRLNFISSKVDLSSAKVLDVGCGGGILSESLAKKGAKVTGIDQGENVIKIAKLHMKESNLNIDYKQLNMTRYVDWFITTPIMLLVLCLAFLYNSGGRLGFSTFLKIFSV